jgi:hypothetical protein
MLPFTRQLGSQAGVQLNYPLDNTEGFDAGNSDQAFATMGVFARGRTDKAFKVTRSNYKRFLGAGGSLSLSTLNEVYLHVYEAFKHGANEAVLSRYERSDAVMQTITIHGMDVVPNNVIGTQGGLLLPAYTGNPNDTEIVIFQHLEKFNDGVIVQAKADLDESGSGGKQAVKMAGNVDFADSTGLSGATVYTASITVDGGSAQPLSVVGSASTTYTDLIAELNADTTGATWTLKNGDLTATSDSTGAASTIALADTDLFSSLTDFNNIETAIVGSVNAPSKMLTVRLLDPVSRKVLYDFYGSLDPTATDDSGNSIFLEDVVSQTTDNVNLLVAENAQVEIDSDLYPDVTPEEWVEELVDYYDEGVAAITSLEIDAAINRLRYNEYEHRYFISAGDQNPLSVSGMATIAKEMNRPFIIDTPAGYTMAQAIVWVDAIPALVSSYCHIYWSPLKARDPINGGKAIWGVSGMQVGYRAARNARTDANGIAPMNYPIAGKEYVIDRLNITQTEFPTENELSDLAKKGINPVLFQTYTAGSNYVFVDSLTNVRKESATKLIAVSEMSSQIDDWIAKYGKEVLQLPILDAIRKLSDFERRLFEAAVTARWIKPSVELDGASFTASVKPNAARPNDRVDTEYALHYDGTLRALYVQQTISR